MSHRRAYIKQSRLIRSQLSRGLSPYSLVQDGVGTVHRSINTRLPLTKAKATERALGVLKEMEAKI